MKTILGFFLLLTWLPSNLGAILPRFELKVLLLVCYFKTIRISGLDFSPVTFSVMCPVAPAALQPEASCAEKPSGVRRKFLSTQLFTNSVIRIESSLCFLLRVFVQGLEHKIPDCAN